MQYLAAKATHVGVKHLIQDRSNASTCSPLARTFVLQSYISSGELATRPLRAHPTKYVRDLGESGKCDSVKRSACAEDGDALRSTMREARQSTMPIGWDSVRKPLSPTCDRAVADWGDVGRTGAERQPSIF